MVFFFLDGDKVCRFVFFVGGKICGCVPDCTRYVLDCTRYMVENEWLRAMVYWFLFHMAIFSGCV